MPVCSSSRCRCFRLATLSQRCPGHHSTSPRRQMEFGKLRLAITATKQRNATTWVCLKPASSSVRPAALYGSLSTPDRTPNASDSLRGAASERSTTPSFGSVQSSNRGEENDQHAHPLLHDTHSAECQHTSMTPRESFILGAESAAFNNWVTNVPYTAIESAVVVGCTFY